MFEKLTRCACGKLYKIAALYCGDQSKCVDCRVKETQEYLEQQGVKADGK